jgi:phosphatidylinositol glycan class T
MQVLRAHFAPTLAPDTLPGLWGNLSHALGGLFCASLNFVARPEATAPLAVSMQPVLTQQLAAGQQLQHEKLPAGQPQQEKGRQHHAELHWVPGPAQEQVLYASLPQEASCTENLTPWLKLLPCRCGCGAESPPVVPATANS